MNRAERRRHEREARKLLTNSGQSDGNPCPNGHLEQFQRLMVNGTPPSRCPRCGEVPEFAGIGMSSGFEDTDYGLPERVTRHWIAANSEKGELMGVVAIPEAHQDGLMTHAVYWPECTCNDDSWEDCACDLDESVMWTLGEYQG